MTATENIYFLSGFENLELTLDWDNVAEPDPDSAGAFTDSISDGLILSLTNLGRVDIEYISSITGETKQSVISALKGSIFQNPDKWHGCFYKGWETAEEYLSGNLRRKWKSAKAANIKYNGLFSDNITAIEKAMPEHIPYDEIYVTLGSPWLPADIIDSFISHMFGEVPWYWSTAYKNAMSVKHDEITGSWDIPNKKRYGWGDIDTTVNYGTDKLNALEIIERTLNMKSVAVYDVVDSDITVSGKARVINKEETLLATEKQKLLIDAFKDWIWTSEKRKARLERIYEEKYSCVRKRHFNGDFLTFPGMSPGISLYPYQKNAVARILFSPNTLIAHDVGSGKTYVCIAAGMKLKQMGLSKKNLFVVPNNIVGQWKSIFLSMYPGANVLCVEPKSFKPEKRIEVLEKIRDNDYDGIIMAYSCFELIKISKSEQRKQLLDLKGKLEAQEKRTGKSTKKLRQKIDSIERDLALLTVKKPDDGLCFDELGITRLFLDEAHNYKNVALETKIQHVLGISSVGSKKCQDMLNKVQLIQRMNDGGGVVFTTGTPITNSITDAYVMQKYLQPGELALLDLQSFDSWVGMFAERQTLFEVDVDTNGYRLATRFSKFHNLPELTKLLASIADFHSADEDDMIPHTDGYSDTLIGRTPEFKDFLKNISERAELIRDHQVRRTVDNMLKITTDGRKAALDMRLIDDKLPFAAMSKVSKCADNVYEIYLKTRDFKGTQLVFCDSSTPKASFNMYDELKRILTDMGVPEDEIAYIHDATTEKKRSTLFKKIQDGDIRILIGSTFKLGLGVNVQNKLYALHHLDIPWRPADMTQREGRILRQGNTNPKVEIHRYITEGSFDAYSWQLLETKQQFIVDLLSGSLEQRSGSDIDDTVLSYAEIKALAIGNPLVKQRIELSNELSRFKSLQRKAYTKRTQLEEELNSIPQKIENQRTKVRNCRSDCDLFVLKSRTHTKAERAALRDLIHKKIADNEFTGVEKLLMNYQGFDILLPANMSMSRPFVWIQGADRYSVELGFNETGDLIRIDNFLEGLEDHCKKLENRLEQIRAHKKSIENVLENPESYADEIEDLKIQINDIDIKLGVKKEEE